MSERARPLSPVALASLVLAALVVAALLLVAIVLPAEYSLDPLGTGRALGLMGLADEASVAVTPEVRSHSNDNAEFQLASFESLEYSYEMARGASMIYSWQADGELVFNLHSSPDLPPSGAPSSYAESFDSGRAQQAQGTYTAPFTGRHGWFWENRTHQQVTLRLSVSGFLHAPVRASAGGQEERQLTPVFGILSAEQTEARQ